MELPFTGPRLKPAWTIRGGGGARAVAVVEDDVAGRAGYMPIRRRHVHRFDYTLSELQKIGELQRALSA